VTTSIQLPARRYGPLGSLWIRVGIALGCLLITTVLVYVEREGYRDSNGTPISWLDALYYATVTLSTTGYGDIVPVTEQARLANVLIITPLRFVFLITLVGTTVEVLTQRSRDEFRIKRWRQRMQDHSVIVGFGVKGRAALTTLMEQGTSASDVVVVTHDRISLNAATALGAVGILGDATSEDVLVQALLPRAKRVIVALDRDDTAVLVTLTARRLNPTATIVASRGRARTSTCCGRAVPTPSSRRRSRPAACSASRSGPLLRAISWRTCSNQRTASRSSSATSPRPSSVSRRPISASTTRSSSRSSVTTSRTGSTRTSSACCSVAIAWSSCGR